MNLLLDMEDQLQRWRSHPAEHDQLLELIDELAALNKGAQMAELEPIEALSEGLSAFYQQVHAGRQQLGDEQFDHVAEAHEALINMMDEVAAGLDVTPQPELVEGLQQLATTVCQGRLSEGTADDVESGPGVLEAADLRIEKPAADPAGTAAMAAHAGLDPDMVEIFLDEALELIESANHNLEQWLASTDSRDRLEALMRDLHTLKGGARMAEISPVGDLAHELESIYVGLLDGRYEVAPLLSNLLHAGHDQLTDLLEQLQAGKELFAPQEMIERLLAFRRGDVDVLVSAGSGGQQPGAIVPTAETADAATPERVAYSGQDELVDIFLEEAFEVLEQMAEHLQGWLAEPDSPAHMESLLRGLHTLKGGARMAEISEVADLVHEFEFLHEDLLAGRISYSEPLGDFMHQVSDKLSEMLEAVREQQQLSPATAEISQIHDWRRLAVGGHVPAQDIEPLTAGSVASETALPIAGDQIAPGTLDAVLAEDEAAHAVNQILPFMRKDVREDSIRRQQQGPQEMIRVPAELVEALVNLAGETSIFRGRVEQQVSDFGLTLHDMETTLDRIRDQLRRLDTETQAQLLRRLQTETEGDDYAEFDPLEMDRHSHLQQLSRSLFESASDLMDLKETLSAKSRDAETLLLQQARVNTELQEGLMRTRMVRFDRLLPRLRRVVRQVSADVGKQVNLEVLNAEGERDRSVLEHRMGPLERMLLTAFDHGAVLPAARNQRGKSETGRITLGLQHEGGVIVLRLSDDGRGVDRKAVRAKAIERGLMDVDAHLTDHEVLQFILQAGFSTAEQVTQISGRGVGMDVVNSEIKQLGGSMTLSTEAGQGTTFTIRLPFTVSVNRALMVYSGDDLYAIPLNTIEGIVRVSGYELEAYYAPGAPAFEYAGKHYDLRYLGDLLGTGQQPRLSGQSLPLPVILVRGAEHSIAVQVDALAGSREIVVKSLGKQFSVLSGISGATILGDGRVVVILDLLAVIRAQQAHAQQARQVLQPAAVEDRATLVMVVDDSITVRKVTGRLLERHGMEVVTAKDGVDAIARLQDIQPDVMLLDIEMPRMDGFEVATLVRHDERLKDLPIIMITSRTGEKHRERARSIGVNEYLGKPYQEAQLLELIGKLVGRGE